MKMMSDGARRAVYLLIFALMATSLTVGSYLLLARFLKDRQSAFSEASRPRSAQRSDGRPSTTRTVQNGRDAQRPVPATTSMPPAVDAGQAAIQRQLKTLEEINRINETNRRLMDQQRRMQNQR